MNQPELREELRRLRSHSQMLGMIAGEVEAWCNSDDCTTLQAVQLLKAAVLEEKAGRLLALSREARLRAATIRSKVREAQKTPEPD